MTTAGSLLFPENYAEGRARFVDLVASTNGSHEPHPHPLSGPDGQPLFLDVASWGPANAPTALLLIAGTHGIEGFAGSGIMATLLDDGLPARLPDNLKLVMIHALNPYGFAWQRRVNEDNIDLNRNFVDHDSAHPANPLYADLADLVAPKTWAQETAEEIAAGFRSFQERHDSNPTAIFSMGQYDHPDGFFYGGNKPAWSNAQLMKIAQAHLSQAEHVYDIDIHTGLGAFGEAEYIVECAPDSAQYQLSQSIWGDGLRSTTTGESKSADVSGSAMSGLKAVLGERIVGIGLEYGTLPVRQVMAALIAERWLHYHGDRNSETGQEISATMRAAFYPDSEEWRTAVTTTARLVVQQVLDHVGG